MDASTALTPTLSYTKKSWYVCLNSHAVFTKDKPYCFSSDGTVSDQRGPIAQNYDVTPDETLFRKWKITDATKGDILASHGSIFSFIEQTPEKNIITQFSYHDNEFFPKEESRSPGPVQPATYKQIALIRSEAYKSGYIFEPLTRTLINKETLSDTTLSIDTLIDNFKNTTLKQIEEEITKAYVRGLIDASKHNKETLANNDVPKAPQFTSDEDMEKISGYDLFK